MRAAEEAEGGDASPRIHPQIDVRAAGDLLARAGFALPVVDRETVDGALRVAGRSWSRDLRAMGATNILAARSRRPFGRLGLAAAAADFAARRADGKTAERFEIVHLSGWAPAPGSAAGRRGAAARTASLADALKPAVALSLAPDQGQQDDRHERRQIRPPAQPSACSSPSSISAQQSASSNGVAAARDQPGEGHDQEQGVVAEQIGARERGGGGERAGARAPVGLAVPEPGSRRRRAASATRPCAIQAGAAPRPAKRSAL